MADLDDAAAILDITEGHLKDLIRDGEVDPRRHEETTRQGRRWIQLMNYHHSARFARMTPGTWWVDGQSVRARRRELQRRGTVR